MSLISSFKTRVKAKIWYVRNFKRLKVFEKVSHFVNSLVERKLNSSASVCNLVPVIMNNGIINAVDR